MLSVDLYKSIIDANPVSVVLLDSAGVIKYYNSAFDSAVFQVDGEPLSSFLSAEHGEKFQTFIDQKNNNTG